MSSSSESKGIALVTGAAQGIGRAITLRLADDGFDVAINDILSNKENLDNVALQVASKGRRTCVMFADVTVEDEVKGMIDGVVTQLGGLDVMVANAGIIRVGTLLETGVDDWEAQFAVNVRGTYLCYRYAAMQMIAQGRGGRMIGASSVAGKTGHANQIAYCSAKFAVRGMTQCAALELGRHGITVNSYAPGAMITPMLEGIRIANDQRNESLGQFYDGDYYKRMADRAAVGYMGKADDVASIVSYLASKESHFITGQSISVDGGVYFS
ncbi:hypothetical protein SERLA73DRAFT_188392 [Serpula lacrymans var. lacrymans S7.3]|uniref:Uncharacterized protein n=2 Tax=Serpula lacrymans var. lacrymans TaxID=341189 RepID=F8QB87_SERL3|nr:uncharacterized protein SERLADRAFT_478481 [Serpula lacrymans var. lacrymans S7.9]EGN94473.1 hypothetical protein SERLA73DRAFT_188392 [Serpula lacrymans var. lacrymans S7.3]EGO19951.1 hypothetical protein SERLADRAFT_478481 [Serpula lacrymans var. lacrymans S7.9]